MHKSQVLKKNVCSFIFVSKNLINEFESRYKVKIDTPKIPENLTERKFTDIFYEEDPEFEMCLVTDSQFDHESIDRLRLYQTVIKNCIFVNTDFSRIDLTDVRFENCDLSNANLGNASMNRVEFINCKLLGSNLTESYIGNTRFEQSILNMTMSVTQNLKK